MLDARNKIGSYDLLWLVLDTLRYDVARDLMARGETPTLAGVVPGAAWQKRHSPGNFTYAAHQAFFAGFWPTPAQPGRHPRLFALAFPGSETSAEQTAVFAAPDVVTGLRKSGYHTICIGGVGFFNLRSPLGAVLPGLFDEAHWSEELGVTDPDSTRKQVQLAVARLDAIPRAQRVLTFLNVSALHQPNKHYLPGATEDSLQSHAAALCYVDGQLAPLFEAVRRRAPTLCIICSDHGTAYGERGYTGHRCSLPCVWEVPYAELLLDGGAG